VPLLHKRLEPEVAPLKSMICQAQREASASSRRSTSDASDRAASDRVALERGASPSGSGDGPGAPSSSLDLSPELSAPSRTGSTSRRLSTLSAQRFNTDAMLQVWRRGAARGAPEAQARLAHHLRPAVQPSHPCPHQHPCQSLSRVETPPAACFPPPHPQVLQQDIRVKSRRSSLALGPDLVLGECLGAGGFGRVHKALWHKVVVAAKVMPANTGERQVRR
jgi:hypothetical protein